MAEYVMPEIRSAPCNYCSNISGHARTEQWVKHFGGTKENEPYWWCKGCSSLLNSNGQRIVLSGIPEYVKGIKEIMERMPQSEAA